MDILSSIYTICKATCQIFLAWAIPLPKIYATVQQVDSNRYKILVHFKDRDVAIQFKRPRGPRGINGNVRPELVPYLQNDMVTPIKIYSVSHQK